MTTNRSVLRWVGAVTVLLLGLAWFAALPTPRASALFSPGLSVSASGYDSFEQRVAVDREGDASLVWIRETQDYPHLLRVQMRSRSHDGVWSPRVLLSPSDQAPGFPNVAVDDDGDAVVVWHAYNGAEYGAYARRVSRTGTLGPVLALATGGTIHGTNVAVDSDGDAVATWAESHSDGSVYPMMRRLSKSGSLSAATVLSSSPASAETPAVAFDREGDAVLAWANDNVVQGRTLSASGTLGPLETMSANLSPIDRHFTAEVTVDRDGDALVTWLHWTAADQSNQVWGRWVSRSGTLGTVRQLTPSTQPDLVNYSVAGDLDGDVMLTWDRAHNGYLYGRQITRTGTLSPLVFVTTFGRLHTVAVDDDGDGVVVYQGQGIDGSVGSIRVRRVTQSGTLGPEQVVASIGESPTMAVTPTGGAMIAWERRFQVDLRIQVSVGP